MKYVAVGAFSLLALISLIEGILLFVIVSKNIQDPCVVYNKTKETYILTNPIGKKITINTYQFMDVNFKGGNNKPLLYFVYMDESHRTKRVALGPIKSKEIVKKRLEEIKYK